MNENNSLQKIPAYFFDFELDFLLSRNCEMNSLAASLLFASIASAVVTVWK